MSRGSMSDAMRRNCCGAGTSAFIRPVSFAAALAPGGSRRVPPGSIRDPKGTHLAKGDCPPTQRREQLDSTPPPSASHPASRPQDGGQDRASQDRWPVEVRELDDEGESHDA